MRPQKQKLSAAIDNWSALQRCGGVRSVERKLASEALHALKSEREHWLSTLMTWEQDWHSRIGNSKPERRDLKEHAYITSEIRRLRRLLGIATPVEEVRAQTRARMRRFRERQRRSQTGYACP